MQPVDEAHSAPGPETQEEAVGSDAELTVLAVDDSFTMRRMVSQTLESIGLQVEVAPDGLRALELARTKRFRLVLTDVQMPEMDGIALVRALRGLPEYRFVPILVLTTESSPEMKQEGRAAGATGWLVKPISPLSLVATVRKVLG